MTHREIEAQAARFLMQREEAGWSPADQAGLDAWLNASAAHQASYWRLEHGWAQADRLRAIAPQLEQGQSQADSSAQSPFGLSLSKPFFFGGRREGRAEDPSTSSGRTERDRTRLYSPMPIWRRRGAWQLAAATLVAGVIAVFAAPMTRPAPPQSYATRIGQRATLALADGSHIELNTDTSLRAEITDMRRAVWLDKGEAYFEIAHDASKPFQVQIGPRRVTVLGTRFALARGDGNKTTLSVVSGRVRFDTSDVRTGGSAIVTSGEIAIGQGSSTLIATDALARIEDGLRWRYGVLRFDRLTIRQAALQFNRYNRRKILVLDDAAGEMVIGGSFKVANIDAFGRLLADAYGLRVSFSKDAVTVAGKS